MNLDRFYFLTGEIVLVDKGNKESRPELFKFQVYYGCSDFILSDVINEINKMFFKVIAGSTNTNLVVGGLVITSRFQISEKEYSLNKEVFNYNFQYFGVV